MEQKTAEEIYQSSAIFISKGKKKGTYSLLDVVTHAMQAYAKQQQEIAVEKALEMVEKYMFNDIDICQQIDVSHLAPQILKELEK